MNNGAMSLTSAFPAPTDEELVAIVSALELVWPRPVVVVASSSAKKPSSAWRFSGRWWSGRAGHK